MPKELINGKLIEVGGCKREKKDKRDFKLSNLGWFGYTSPHEEFEIPIVSQKDQSPNNTCTQVALTGVNEIEQKKDTELSEQFLTCTSKQDGKISSNGFSTLTGQLKNLLKYGQCEKKYLNGNQNDWNSYSSANNLTTEVLERAKENRIQSYWNAGNRSERLKAIDEGHALFTAMDWYQEFCIYGGFSTPWLITGNGQTYQLGETAKTNWLFTLLKLLKIVPFLFQKLIGVFVGGHSIYIRGHKKNYYGHSVYKMQNSYGLSWGDNGAFYVDMNYFDAYGQPTYVILDIPVDTAQFLQDYNFKFVKSEDLTKKAIYMIVGGEKRPFTNWMVYLAFGGGKGKAEAVSDEILNSIKTGLPLPVEESDSWPLIQELAKPDNIKLVIDAAKI